MSPLYKELKVLKLRDLFYFNLAALAHDYYHSDSLPEKLSSNLVKKRDITSAITRNNEFELSYSKPRLTSTFKKPSISISIVWNSIPTDIRMVKSKSSFKNKIKDHYLSQY